MPKYLVYGKVTSTSDEGVRVLAEGSIVKEATSPDALKAFWFADMKKVFHDGPYDTVDYFCRVTPVPVAAPPLPETRAGADEFARPAGVENVALDTILSARAQGSLRNMAAVAWSNLLSMVFGGRRV